VESLVPKCEGPGAPGTYGEANRSLFARMGFLQQLNLQFSAPQRILLSFL
jgi:hypothetical protein